jgi:hypothetical protein
LRMGFHILLVMVTLPIIIIVFVIQAMMMYDLKYTVNYIKALYTPLFFEPIVTHSARQLARFNEAIKDVFIVRLHEPPR